MTTLTTCSSNDIAENFLTWELNNTHSLLSNKGVMSVLYNPYLDPTMSWFLGTSTVNCINLTLILQ